MDEFTIFPAIDLRAGNVVRLVQGDPDRQTTYGNNPVVVAQRWIDTGATWLHIINLDGAFGEKGRKNKEALREIIGVVKNSQSGVKIQFGGGIRSIADMEYVFSIGIERIILGSITILHPNLASEALSTFGTSSFAAAMDVRDSEVLVHGWQEGVGIDPISQGIKFSKMGFETCVYTNTVHDGCSSGIDIESTRQFASATDLTVIASGGFARIEEIKLIREAGLSGVIIGRALYDGSIKLEEALLC